MIAGRYELRDRIGSGAFGEVFEAYDQRLRRLVALKTLPIEAVSEAEATEEFRRFHLEARAVARLSHPGIVTVHDFGETPEFAWIVMELVIGETLKAVLDRGERPGLQETGRIIGELLDALHYAHGRGIVHRDVKPANILLAISAAEGLGEVRLADFGVARVGEAQQTLVGQIVGTPTTMSPEQVRGEAVDQRSDLWSVGVILYQMLTGERPFAGTMPAIFQNILTRTPNPPSMLLAGLSPRVDAVVATALAKNPGDRYPSAAAMAAALRAAIGQPSPEAEAETVMMAVVAPPPAAPVAPLSVAAPPAPMLPAPMPQMAAAPPRRGWLRVRRGLAMAGIFATGLACGLAWPRLEAMDLSSAATAGVQAFVANLDQTKALDGVPAAPSAPAASDSPGKTELTREERGVDSAATVPDLTPAASGTIPPATGSDLIPPALVPDLTPPATVPDLTPAASAPDLTPPGAALDLTPAASVPDLAPTAAVPDPSPAEVPHPASTAAIPASLAPPPVPLPAEGTARCDRDRLATRSGSHPGFGRLVFHWTGPIRHEVEPVQNGALLRFPGAGCLPGVEQLGLPRNVRAIRPDEARTALRIETTPAARIRTYRMDGNRVVLDVLDGAE
ncbi:serine/threonine-protein kinase [Roseococcus sp. SYP-B2431]|uniref:serine/threonine-protein kinase n=1 Tax=Roseococcus sp. SYP-B2431 TaxID=2496640 RepID=UPI0013F42F1E|nr:serine/threonine-protein kinase [Roseococcus sp. SYP-B2431]